MHKYRQTELTLFFGLILVSVQIIESSSQNRDPFASYRTRPLRSSNVTGPYDPSRFAQATGAGTSDFALTIPENDRIAIEISNFLTFYQKYKREFFGQANSLHQASRLTADIIDGQMSSLMQHLRENEACCDKFKWQAADVYRYIHNVQRDDVRRPYMNLASVQDLKRSARNVAGDLIDN